MCQNCLRISFLQDKSRLYVPTGITSSLTPLVFVNPFLYRNIEFTNTYLYRIWWETFFSFLEKIWNHIFLITLSTFMFIFLKKGEISINAREEPTRFMLMTLKKLFWIYCMLWRSCVLKGFERMTFLF